MSRNYFLIVSCIALFANSVLSSDYVPVYLWQTNKVSNDVPAIPHVSSETFTELLPERLGKDTFVVSFVEPNLSPEDFSGVTDSGEQVFSQLSQLGSGGSTAYLPLVEEPVDALQKLFSEDIASVQAKDFDVEAVKTSALIVDLNDIGDDEDRPSMLSRHDKAIADIYSQLSKKYKHVVALFTGLEASWVTPEDVLNRKVRDTQQSGNTKDDEIPSTAWLFKDEFILLYASDTPVLFVDGSEVNMAGYTHFSEASDDKTNITVTLKKAGEASVEMVFEVDRGYWQLTNLGIRRTNGSVINLRTKKINPPATFSYQCTSQVFTDGTQRNTWSLKNFQVQPFSNGNNNTFGDAYYCVGFTSVPIWSGLFVTFILATIMALGLMMMLDMKTMDRFDDPKGKTIIVNASE